MGATASPILRSCIHHEAAARGQVLAHAGQEPLDVGARVQVQGRVEGGHHEWEPASQAAGAHVDSPLLSVEIRHPEGAAGRTAPGAGASALIPAPYAVFAVGPTPDKTTAASVNRHLRRVRAALKPWSSAVGYLHFTVDRATCFAPDVAARLTDAKALWDAGNLITSNEPRPSETTLASRPSAT